MGIRSQEASVMLMPWHRNPKAPSRGNKFVPQKARSLASSWNFPALSYVIDFYQGRDIPPYVLDGLPMIRSLRRPCTAKALAGISVIGVRPSKGSSPAKASNLQSVEYGPTGM